MNVYNVFLCHIMANANNGWIITFSEMPCIRICGCLVHEPSSIYCWLFRREVRFVVWNNYNYIIHININVRLDILTVAQILWYECINDCEYIFYSLVLCFGSDCCTIENAMKSTTRWKCKANLYIYNIRYTLQTQQKTIITRDSVLII